MAYFQSTYHSKIYRDFREIGISEYRAVIRFYEENESEIRHLDFKEYFELLVAYTNALFEIGSYQKHLLMVDTVLETTIQNNISTYKGENIFNGMLFKKAASHYNVLDYDKADYILRELIKIEPGDEDSAMFLKKCLRKKQPAFIKNTRATSIFLFLLTALVICIEVLFVRPFYDMHAKLVETSRMSIFFMGFLILVGGDLYHRWLVEKEVNNYVAEVKNTKQQKSSSPI